MKILHKGCIGLVSAWKVLCAKICACGKFQATWVNSIRGALKIEIIGNGCIAVGHFLMSKRAALSKICEWWENYYWRKCFF